jgi:hypothetical protein
VLAFCGSVRSCPADDHRCDGPGVLQVTRILGNISRLRACRILNRRFKLQVLSNILSWPFSGIQQTWFPTRHPPRAALEFEVEFLEIEPFRVQIHNHQTDIVYQCKFSSGRCTYNFTTEKYSSEALRSGLLNLHKRLQNSLGTWSGLHSRPQVETQV